MEDDNNEKRPTGPIDGGAGEEEEQEEERGPSSSAGSSPAAPAAAAAAPNEGTGVEEGSSRGDPRMRRACLARIANPKLSLLGALKIGGFTFQQENPTCEDFDNDGVRLRQRKNQLCRRIRKEKAAEDTGGRSGDNKKRKSSGDGSKGKKSKSTPSKRASGGSEADLARGAASDLIRLASLKVCANNSGASGGRRGQNHGDSSSDGDSDDSVDVLCNKDDDRKPPAIREGAGNMAGVPSFSQSLSAPPGSVNIPLSVGAPPVLPQRSSFQPPALPAIATQGEIGALGGGGNGLISDLLEAHLASICGGPPPTNTLALLASLQQGIPLQQPPPPAPAPRALQLEALIALVGGTVAPPPPPAVHAVHAALGYSIPQQEEASSNPDLAAVIAAISRGSIQRNQIAPPSANNAIPTPSFNAVISELMRRNPTNAASILQIAQAVGGRTGPMVPAPAPILSPPTQNPNNALSAALIAVIQEQQQQQQQQQPQQNQAGDPNSPSNSGRGPTPGK